MSKKDLISFSLFFIYILFLYSLGFAQQESITITTYYPSPYGSYGELRAQRMAIGTNYFGSNYCWSPESCTYTISNADLVVEGHVGIGTATPIPNSELHVHSEAWPGLGEIRISGSGINNQTYSALMLDDNDTTTADNNVWSIAHKKETGTVYEDALHIGMWDKHSTGYIYAVIQTDGHVGIGTADPGSYRLNVAGTIYTSGGCPSCSDVRWKKNITPINDSLTLISKLQGVRFNWRSDEYPKMFFGNSTDVGLIAQNVEKVMPELVYEVDGYKYLKYERLVPLLIEAVKAQQKQIDELKAKLEAESR